MIASLQKLCKYVKKQWIEGQIAPEGKMQCYHYHQIFCQNSYGAFLFLGFWCLWRDSICDTMLCFSCRVLSVRAIHPHQ